MVYVVGVCWCVCGESFFVWACGVCEVYNVYCVYFVYGVCLVVCVCV